MELNEIKERIFRFFEEQKKSEGLEYDTELLKSKYVNSLFALQIVAYVEKEFGIKLKRKEISEKNFHSINAIADLVEQHVSGK